MNNETMEFHVAGLLKEPLGATRRYELAEEVGRLDEQLTATEPVKGQVKLTRTKDGILVEAELRSALLVTCSRCLVDFSAPVEVKFREQFQPVVDVETGLPLPGPEDRSVFTIDETHVLDLREAFRQYALLALPMAPICDAACAGLCPQCGKNLNEGPCDCPPAPGDERWGALAELLKDDRQGSTPKARKSGRR
ncbi:MAG: DUF177 domain-containing protein [Chloroflexi bacterium]|nr:DUF177 domain-containing protein [Chloroflexota bacterium]